MSKYELLLKQIVAVGAIAMIGGSIAGVAYKGTDWAELLLLAAGLGFVAVLFALLGLARHYWYEDHNWYKHDNEDDEQK